MINRLLFVGLLALAPMGESVAAAGDQYFPANPFDLRFCAGLDIEFRTGNGTRYECKTSTTAIVVEYHDYWREAIGQSLAFAAETGLTPGIVLVCRNDLGHCINAAKGVEAAFAKLKSPVALWDCNITDTRLSDCDRLE
jgi:hypothetical protein